MIAIRIVVCPVDFSAATDRQVKLAGDVCRAFGARLILHHNVTDVSVGAGVGWMWQAGHSSPRPISVDSELRAIVRQLPQGIETETCITRGAVTEAVLAVSNAAEADLVVLSAHAGKTEDHASVIEYLLEYSSRAVLALHDPGEDAAAPRFVPGDDADAALQSVLVPVNLTGAAHPQLDLAFDLARVFPLRLRLLHVTALHAYRDRPPAESLRFELQALVPADLADRTAIYIEAGDPVSVIGDAARHLEASCILMGEHTRVPVKRWFTHDTARAVLHQAHCPVWYVPSTKGLPMSFSRVALSTEKSILWGNV